MIRHQALTTTTATDYVMHPCFVDGKDVEHQATLPIRTKQTLPCGCVSWCATTCEGADYWYEPRQDRCARHVEGAQ